jgi:fatty acid desaturase
VIGGSQRLWRHKHNRLHHIYTNMDAIDMVAETCHAFALPYICYPTVRAAIAGHYRFLKTMGRQPNVLSSPSSPGTTPPAAIITATPGRSWGMQ